MATLITEPANSNPATIDWQSLIAKTTKVMGECAKFRLTNMTADTEPQIEAGSRFEINGSYYQCASAENITGWSSIGLNRFVYVYATPSGGSATFSYSETAPTFDSAKGGWFNSTARALFKIYKTTSTGWTAKRYVDLVEGISGSLTDVLSRDLGANWSTALLASAGAGMLAQLLTVDGSGCGLDADLHDGFHAGNGSGQIPVSNNVKCVNLYAEKAYSSEVSDIANTAGNSYAVRAQPYGTGVVAGDYLVVSNTGTISYEAVTTYTLVPINKLYIRVYLF